MSRILLAIVAVAAVLAGGYWFIVISGQKAPATGDLGVTLSAPQAAQTQAGTTNPNQQTMTATIHTSKGDITVEFFAADAPNTAANFAKLAKAGFYDGTKFHRVIKGFMDQGGDPLSKDDTKAAQWGTGGPGYKFNDENVAAHNGVGVVAMANSGPNTNGSQFFINAADNGFLDGKYSVFGKVVAGLDVVMAINNVPTGASDRPLEPIVINSITLQ